MIFGIIKFIFFYFLYETLSCVGVVAEVGTTIVLDWLRSLKNERILPFSSYYTIFDKKMKEVTNRKDKRYIIEMAIPFVNMICIIPSLVEACKNVTNSPEYMKESHEISNIEREGISVIKRDTGLHLVDKVKKLEKFVINIVDIDTVLKSIEKGRFYMVGETYTFDECSYVSFGTNMRVTFGKINGNMYAIFDGCEEEIKELFPNFIPIDPDEITDEKMSLIFLRRPNDADICYIITHILNTRHNMETIDSKIIPEEPENNGDVVKLTK